MCVCLFKHTKKAAHWTRYMLPHLNRITKRRYFMKMEAICFTLDLGYSVCCYFSGATAAPCLTQNWSHCKHFICFMNMFLQCARIDEIDAIFVWMCDAACYGHLKGTGTSTNATKNDKANIKKTHSTQTKRIYYTCIMRCMHIRHNLKGQFCQFAGQR